VRQFPLVLFRLSAKFAGLGGSLSFDSTNALVWLVGYIAKNCHNWAWTQRPKAHFEARARILKALAHPSRLFIVDQLTQGERCVCELTEMVGSDMSTVSKHLSVLKSAGVVADQKRGMQVYYRLKMSCALRFFECVGEVIEQTARDQMEMANISERKGLMRIQILGTGCAKCKQLAENAETAARNLGLGYQLEKITDIKDIMKFGVIATPSLAIDGMVRLVGKVVTAAEIQMILTSSINS
jgi:small redox-active disulfide protein 2